LNLRCRRIKNLPTEEKENANEIYLGREAVFNDDEKEYELIDGQQLSGGTTAKGLEREEEKQRRHYNSLS
jgi:hypothetical protein